MPHTLYYSRGSCSLAVHMVLKHLQLPHKLVAVNLKTAQTEDGRDFKAIQPLGYVPYLQCEDGSAWHEVTVVLQYLASLVPQEKLMGEDSWRTMQWLAFISTELHKGFSPLFNPSTTEPQKEAYRARLHSRLDYTEQHFVGDYLLGGLTVADFYLFTVLRWSAIMKVDLAAKPKLTAWMQRMKRLESVAGAMQIEKL